MASSQAATVAAYLAELPPERSAVVAAVRQVILDHLPAGYVETMNWGMICYEIPLERYPTTYNRQPLQYVALAAQKNYYALYLMACYGSPALLADLQAGYAAAGLKLDMGKSCVRFKRLEALPLDLIGQIVSRVTPDTYIAHYERAKA